LQTGVVGTPVPVLSGAVRVAAGFDALWTTGTVDRLTRVVPSTDGGAPVQRAVVVGRGPTAVAAGVDAVWVANTQAGTVSRVDPNTMTVTGTYKVGADPDSIAVAPDGQVVVGYSSGTVVEVLGIASKSQVLDVGTHPQDVVTAGSGVWVAGSHPGRVATAA
ncbi:MAG TPA: hypothetical protein VEG62_08260, partial [Acidimicrobiales bacterium]|nr:hypothetical protein [Acidimicrobiales bacterium]